MIRLYNLTNRTAYKLDFKNKNMNKEMLWEALKEPLRLLVLAVIPVAITYLTGISEQWAVLAVLILRFIDKVMHEAGKEQENPTLEKGLTRF